MAPVDLTDATKNWLKAAFALKHLKKGLLPFINNEISTFHNNLIATHGVCNQCTSENVLKCSTKNVCRKNKYGICQYHDNGNPLRQSRPCPVGVCDNIRDAIIREHIKGEPMWRNTDATKWSSDAWEVAKCYLPPGSNNAASSQDTDCTGIISLCLHCLTLTARVGHVKHDLEKNRDNRNTLMHSGRQELSDADRSSFIQDAIRLLSTYQTPVSQHTQECIDTLNQIDADGLVLTTDDIIDVMETKVEVIRKKQQGLEVELQESNENTAENAAAIADHNTKLDAYKDEIKKLDDDLKATNSILQRLEETDVKQLQNKMETIRKQNESFCEQINKHIETLETKVKEHAELHKEHAEKIKIHDESHTKHDEQHKEHTKIIKVHGENLKEHDELHKEHTKVLKVHGENLKEHDELHKEHTQIITVHDESLKEHDELHKEHTEMIKVHSEHLKEHDEQHEELEERVNKQKSTVEELAERVNKQETTVGQKLDDVVTRVETLQQISSRFPKLDDAMQENIPGRSQGQQSGTTNTKMRTDDAIAEAADSQDVGKMRGRKRLRDHLINTYKEHYSDMCLAPPTDMWADFVEHYHEPDMRQIEIPGKSQEQKDEKENNIAIQSYGQIFHRAGKPCRKIYVKGDAGSGKSVFCQRMVNKWCEIHSSIMAEDGLSKCDTASDEQTDTEMLEQFDFIFYIELRYATKLYDIEAIIRENILYNNKELLDQLTDVLENESEKCLVLCDGLDEWSAPEGSAVSQFVTHGLPDRKKYNWTILTTSRPCKLETIRPKPGDMDQLIELSGLTKRSVKETVKSVIGYLNSNYLKTDISPKLPEECSKYLQRNVHSQILTLPIILKYLVCIWFEGGDVGKTKCDMYAAMLDLFLRYGKAHTKFNQNTNQTINQNTLSGCDIGTACNDLPRGFRNRTSCQSLKQPLYKLSKLAFHTLFCKDRSSSLVFDNYTTNIHGLSETEVDTWLEIGLLSKDRVDTSCTKNEKMISFPHKTIQEFLAAVHISMHFDPDNAVLPTVKDICGTVDMVFEMSQVFVFLSGMAPTIVTTISRHISQVVSADGAVQRYRGTITDKYSTEQSRVEAIQELMVNCIRESVDTGLTDIQIHIQDIVDDSGMETCSIETLFKLNKSALISFRVGEDGWKQMKAMTGDMCCLHLSKLNKLELQLNKYCNDGDDDEVVVVSTIRSCMKTLKVISLKEFSFSRSTSKQLFQSLPYVLDVQFISVAFNIHELQHMQQLQELYLDGIICTHCPVPCQLDLSKLNQLQRLRIEQFYVDTVQINTSQLEECVIVPPIRFLSYSTTFLMVHGDGRHLRTLEFAYLCMKHEQLKQLLLVVKQHIGLREITLNEVNCSDCDTACTCRLDLSQHTQIERLHLQKLRVSGVQINTAQLNRCELDSLKPASSAPCELGSEMNFLTCHGDSIKLENVTISNMVTNHKQLEQLMLVVSRATSLRWIILNDVSCGDCTAGCTCIWRLDLSQHTQLEILNIQKIHVSEVQIDTTKLRSLEITDIIMKHEQLEQFMLFVTRATRLKLITLNDVKCGDCTAGCTCRLDLSQHTQLRRLEVQKLHVSQLHINTTQLEICIIDSLRPASSAPSEPGSEEISLMFHGDGKRLRYLTIRNVVLKHEQLKQLTLFVTRAAALWKITLNNVTCGDCTAGCTWQLDLSQQTRLERLVLQKLHVNEVHINTTWLRMCTINSLKPASSAPREPGSEEISLVFHGDGEKLGYMQLTNIVMKHEQLEQMVSFVKRAPGSATTEINEIKCSNCGNECSIQLEDTSILLNAQPEKVLCASSTDQKKKVRARKSTNV